jgi:hypothetical protein
MAAPGGREDHLCVNSTPAPARLSDPRDVSFALHALLGNPCPAGPQAIHDLAAALPQSPTVDEVVEVVFTSRSSGPGDETARLKARSVLAAYFAWDPPVDPDPSA